MGPAGDRLDTRLPRRLSLGTIELRLALELGVVIAGPAGGQHERVRGRGDRDPQRHLVRNAPLPAVAGPAVDRAATANLRQPGAAVGPASGEAGLGAAQVLRHCQAAGHDGPLVRLGGAGLDATRRFIVQLLDRRLYHHLKRSPAPIRDGFGDELAASLVRFCFQDALVECERPVRLDWMHPGAHILFARRARRILRRRRIQHLVDGDGFRV